MASTLDLVLINPRSRKQVYQSLGGELAAIENPVWAGLMATFCRKHGLSVELIDAEAYELDHAAVAGQVADLNPTLAVVVVYGHQPSASTQIMPASGAVVRAIKEAGNTPVLMVGGHVAALPARTMEEEVCDYVAAGEGLYTMVELAKALKASATAPELSKVRGLWYRESNGKLNFTPNPPLVQNVDVEMPGIAWDLLPMSRYRAHNWHCFDDLQRQPYAAIYTTLGCPYHCSFCCIQAPFKSGEKELGLKETANSYRYWDPKLVGDELEKLAGMGVRNIKIADEMFVLNKKHVLGICDEIINRGLTFNIWAYARVDTVKEGMLPKLKQAGFNWLAFGIEAANERVQQNVEKRFDTQEIYDTIRKVKEHGIAIIGNYIFGLPEDDHASMQETLDLALDLNCEFANLYSAMAYPGSPLFTMAMAEGWKLPEKWSGYSQHSVDSTPLPTKYLPASEVLKFRDEAFLKYFRDPGYLDMIQKRYGAETVAHINAMTQHKLDRQLVPSAAGKSAA